MKAPYRQGKDTVVYTVSRLTKPWAYKSAERVIRALSGDLFKNKKIKIVSSKED